MASFVRSTLYFFLLFAVSLQVYGKPRGIREIVETRWNKRGQVGKTSKMAYNFSKSKAVLTNPIENFANIVCEIKNMVTFS